MRARIRTVKPEIHTDEELWDLEQETGLPLLRAFIGLWNYADRDGRLEWRPRALKALILPYWGGDFERVLDALATRAFLVPYASGTRRLAVIRNFGRHQVINNKEPRSELPCPPENFQDYDEMRTRYEHMRDAWLTRGSRVAHASATPLSFSQGERKGTEGNGRECGGDGADAPPAPSAPDTPRPKAKKQSQPRERERNPIYDAVVEAFEEAHREAHGAAHGNLGGSLVGKVVAWAKGEPTEDKVGLVKRAVAGYFADPYWREQGSHPFAPFANAPGKALAKAPKPKPSYPRLEDNCDIFREVADGK